MSHLILGGARSGKSSLAERLALSAYAQSSSAAAHSLFYLATSTPFTPADIGEEESTQYENMIERIKHHQTHRDERFQTIEEPLAISTVIDAVKHGQVLLLDCLTLWLSNCLMQGYNIANDDVDLSFWLNQKALFLNSLENTSGTIFLVSNEVGQGVIPLGKLSRVFVDQAGWLHQDVANLVKNVSLVTAGIEQRLK